MKSLIVAILLFTNSAFAVKTADPGITKRSKFNVSGTTVSLGNQFSMDWINTGTPPSRAGAGNYNVTIKDDWYISGSDQLACACSSFIPGTLCQAIPSSRTVVNVRIYMVAIAILATLLPMDSGFTMSCWGEVAPDM